MPELNTVAQAATVATSQAQTNTSYGDLATVGPSVTLQTRTEVMIWLSALSSHLGDGNTSFMSVAVSGATTLAASDANGVASTAEWGGAAFTLAVPLSRVLILTGLTPGLNTFTAKYRVDGSTFNFSNRSIAVLAL